jgi:bifunctional non-homologous end joining protein LigD
VPISWDELSAATTPDRYTVETLPRRVAELSRDPWEGFERARATLTPEMFAVARSR